ncbi:NACHT domain-containing protein [Streptomyces sp. ISID311]|uniref:NACHT domain-containing protein n=1 Tax=Streptomyces sp. ISID311 TaxID=2601673 RepID=UPI0011BD4276|nr:NACHT domain-containing protein [Streptomyces sp. ISID311]TXC95232.1 NACHT domain-containing protein [Streptomyces sp. ISID311]
MAVGLASLAVSWLGYRAGRRQHASGLPLNGIVDELALAVRAQWEAEARTRRLNDPYPLPVSWAPAEPAYRPDADAAALSGTGADITDVFDRVPGGRLLVLGEPGAGKTMLLVRLLLGLIERRAPGLPVPVIFPLASWDPSHQDLADWLADRLTTDHPALALPAPGQDQGAPRVSRARALLDRRLVLPLLDGFDELPRHLRAAALDAINQALPPGHPLVLTSRLAEYDAVLTPAAGVPTHLNGAAAITLRPLTPSDAAAYLVRDAGGRGSPSATRWQPVLDQLADEGSPVSQVLRTPLALFLARTIYNPRPVAGPLTPGPAPSLPAPDTLLRFEDPAALRTHLFDAFVPAAYRDVTPERATQAEDAFTLLAEHLDHRLGGAVDIEWWRLRALAPKAGLRRRVAVVLWLWFALITLACAAYVYVHHNLENPYFTSGMTVSILLPFVFVLKATHFQDPWLSLLQATLLTLALEIAVARLLASTIRFRPRQAPATAMAWTWPASWRAIAVGISPGLGVGIMIANGFGWFGGVVWGFGTGIVLWSLSGWGVVPADLSAAVHATALLEQDRRVFWRFVLVISAAGAALGTLLGMVPGFLRALTYPPPYNTLESPYLLFPAGIGLGVALLFSPALALVIAFSRTAWGEAALTRHYLARRRNGRRLPRDLMAFLADAHEHRGVLRQIGPVYQFRHIDLQRRLANRLPAARR